jgi:hypothetical protein
MDTSKEVLIIIGAGSSQQVHQFDVLESGAVIVPLHWALRKRLTGGTLCLPDMTCATVSDGRFAGLASVEELGAPLGSYIILMLIGLFTLSIPVRIKLVLTDIRPIDLNGLCELLKEAVHRNPSHYTRASASDIERRLSRARTFAHVRRAFD